MIFAYTSPITNTLVLLIILFLMIAMDSLLVGAWLRRIMKR